MTLANDHAIRTEPARERWRARFAGHVIADSDDALVLHEVGLPPVIYFPRDAVSTEYMSRTDHHSRCPHKGDASYYSLLMDGDLAENVAWTYENPYPAAEAIAGRMAFYADRVEVYAVDDARVNPHHEDRPIRDHGVDEVVQHTDSGGGTSQRDHWEANVKGPSPDGGVR